MWPAGDPTYHVHFLGLSSGLTVRMIEAGPDDGPAVLMLPGWGVCAYTFRGNLAGLASAGYRAIAVDLKGHGRSDKPLGGAEYTLGSLVAHVREIIAALGLVRPALVAQFPVAIVDGGDRSGAHDALQVVTRKTGHFRHRFLQRHLDFG